MRKTFGPAVALDSFDLDIEEGEIHALVGQNGSGKSTVVKILAGLHRPDSGSEISVDGAQLDLPVRPAALRRAGVSFVHQDLGLVPEKTITQNIAVGGFALRRDRMTIDWPRERYIAAALLSRLDIEALPDTLVADLGPADRSRVAIARALRSQTAGSGVLVLDEPSRALPPAALADFHRTISKLASEGGSVLLISHNLEEVMALAQRVSILRDGVLVRSLRTDDTDEHEIATSMLGHAVQPRTKSPFVGTVTNRARGAALSDLRIDGESLPDFSIGAGEVVGLTGLSGSVWERVPYALAGATTVESGSLTLNERSHRLKGFAVRRAIATGVALVPERRAEDGLALSRTVTENIVVPWLGRGNRKLVRKKHNRKPVDRLIDALEVRPADPDAVVGTLSGGNQQKVLLAKWHFGSPTLLVLHEPTQAVDVGAREVILESVREAAARGTSVLYASMQPADLVEVCDRVLVLRDDRLIELTELTTDAVLDAVYARNDSMTSQRITP